MLRALAFATGISAVTYLAVSIIGLLLVPILVATYGLATFGLIVLARVFLPTGGLAFFDFGFSEVAVISIAKARAVAAWDVASRQLSLLALGALIVGSVVAAALFVLSGALTDWFAVPARSAGAFQAVLRTTAVALPLLFLSLVLEGVLKGYERFGYQRGCELLSTLIYAVGALGAAWHRLPFEYVCYAQIAGQVVRMGVVGIGVMASGRGQLRPQAADTNDLASVWGYCRLVFVGKMIGAVQSQAPAIVIGALLTPSAVAVYDVLGRLPRFAKAALGLISNTLLASAIRLGSAGDTRNHARLREGGMLAILVIVTPPLAAGAYFSEAILRLWIGPQVSSLWIWQSLMFAVPAMTVIGSYGANFVFDRPDRIAQLNRILIVQIVSQFGIAFAALHWLHELAFILGQAMAMALTFPLQLWLFRRADPGVGLWLPKLMGRACTLFVLVGVALIVFGSPKLASLTLLIAAFPAWAIGYAGITWFVVFDARQRTEIAEIVRRLLRRRTEGLA